LFLIASSDCTFPYSLLNKILKRHFLGVSFLKAVAEMPIGPGEQQKNGRLPLEVSFSFHFSKLRLFFYFSKETLSLILLSHF